MVINLRRKIVTLSLSKGARKEFYPGLKLKKAALPDSLDLFTAAFV